MKENTHAFSLVFMTFLPLAAAFVIAFGQTGRGEKFSRWCALAVSLATLFISLKFWSGMKTSPGEYTAFVSKDWIPDFGITFTMGLDGLSGLLVLLTNFLVVISILASWTAIGERSKEFYAFLLALQTGILGTFLALDLFLFYIFWEMMLVPLYFLIGIFGSANRIYATMKFFLYTMAGSVLMLIGIVALHFQTAPLMPSNGSFSILELVKYSSQLPSQTQTLIFFSFFLAFAIKVPLFPLHTWLPDAHTEAPTAGSILLAGVLLKTGVYGLMRFAIPLFPSVAHDYASWIMLFAVIAIIYGALTAFAQNDMKRLVAYSSVSHMGFIVLGLFAFNPQATAGAALQMVNHGISTGALFFCVGVLYERRHTRLLSEFGGLAHTMPIYAILTIIVVLSSAGLPGLNGFVGEFLILLGTFQSHPFYAALASTGVILAAVYLLRMVQLTFWGPVTNGENSKLPDVNLREICSLAAFILLALWLGLFPGNCLKVVEPASRHLSGIVPSPAAESNLAQAPRLR
ncbi:NADH-quinone oxidoreductase subunit M [Candidatus Sumerlaeota bacterium]|nr:NADH-quinone oxidoreductase subunit M [Candidatus Sumerlaeota bacterium]